MKILEVFIPQDKAWFRLVTAADGDKLTVKDNVLTHKWKTPEGSPVTTTYHLTQFAAYSVI